MKNRSRDFRVKDDAGGRELESGLGGWFGFYNGERPHQDLNSRTPTAISFATSAGVRG